MPASKLVLNANLSSQVDIIKYAKGTDTIKPAKARNEKFLDNNKITESTVLPNTFLIPISFFLNAVV